MSVIIKGMTMPDNCYECRFMEVIERYEGVEQYICLAHLNRITDLMRRLDTCPLVELPDHGDLVDMDYIKDHWPNAQYFGAPVVIPAERERSEDEQT